MRIPRVWRRVAALLALAVALPLACCGKPPASSGGAGSAENSLATPGGDTSSVPGNSSPGVSKGDTSEAPGGSSGGAAGDGQSSTGGSGATEGGDEMIITVSDGRHTVTFRLNDTPAARSLYSQLPLSVPVENYSDNEKIFYPAPLDTTDAVPASPVKGTLAYFSPWGDVVMYYAPAGKYPGLYELGEAISGADDIGLLSGTVTVSGR